MNNTNSSESRKTFSKIYQCYRTLMSQDVSEYENQRSRLVFPILPIPILTELCNFTAKVFAEESIVLNLKGNYVIVGDLHGHILDLFRILRNFGHPPKQNYVFLGDLVDRGEFSTETVVLIFLMKCLYPENVFVIRGNHEFTELWPTCGFLTELETVYNESKTTSSLFMKAFSYLPLAAIVNDKYFCVHGGIGPEMLSVKEMMRMSRPIMDFDSEPVLSMVWSDLSNTIKEFEPSNRGTGYLFGEPALASYLDSQNLDVLVRGHECVLGGVEFSIRKKCITVFSASNYCGVTDNDAGVLILRPDAPPEPIKLKALHYINRETASYLKSSSETSFILSSKPINLNSPPHNPVNHNSPISFPKLNRGGFNSPIPERNNLSEFPSANFDSNRPRQIHSNPSIAISRPGAIRRSFDRSVLIQQREKEQFPSLPSIQPVLGSLPSPIGSPPSDPYSSNYYPEMRRPSRPRAAPKRSSIQSLPASPMPIQQPQVPINRKRRNRTLSLNDNLSKSQPQFENVNKSNSSSSSRISNAPSSPIAPKLALYE